jgi:hypothetical protein
MTRFTLHCADQTDQNHDWLASAAAARDIDAEPGR